MNVTNKFKHSMNGERCRRK